MTNTNVRPCDEPCPKCGNADISRIFIPKGETVPHEGYDKCSSKFGTGQCHSWQATRDHIHNTCRCCGFRWQVLPMKRGRVAEAAKIGDEVDRLRRDCAEAYQVVGVLAAAWMDEDDTGIAQEDFERALDNLSAAGCGEERPHDDLLPWPGKRVGT